MPADQDSLLSDPLLIAADAVLRRCRADGITVATAESCTGGLIAAALTAIAGSSDVVECGFVTYSNRAKAAMLGVPSSMIDRHGAVSEPVARAMAEGALAHSQAGMAVSVTGIAGPGGGSVGKPVGLVWFGHARRGGTASAERMIFPGDRTAIRQAAALHALGLLTRGPD